MDRDRAIIVIPARMGSSRLPGKPLADLGGTPMVVRVMERAMGSVCAGRVLVATDSVDVAREVRRRGGEVVLTSPDHRSGSDRVWEAVADQDVDVVVNLQGDEPFVDPALLDRLVMEVACGAPVVTAAAPMGGDMARPSVVKVTVDDRGLAVGFHRSIPMDVPALQHLGIYAYRKDVLASFVALSPTAGELAEHLEQLRLLENGIPIKVIPAGSAPLSVDTPHDLSEARRLVALEEGRRLG